MDKLRASLAFPADHYNERIAIRIAPGRRTKAQMIPANSNPNSSFMRNGIGVFIAFIRILVPIGLGWLLVQILNSAMAIVAAISLAVVLPFVGCRLLVSSQVGQTNWRNQIAGWLIPWGYRIGNGKLPLIAVVSAIVWLALMHVGIFVFSPPVGGQPVAAQMPNSWSHVWLALAWIVDGAAFLYLAGQLARNPNLSRPPGSTLAKCLAGVAAIVIASVVACVAGRIGLALAIAGVPPLVLAIFAGVIGGLIIVSGRKTRWN